MNLKLTRRKDFSKTKKIEQDALLVLQKLLCVITKHIIYRRKTVTTIFAFYDFFLSFSKCNIFMIYKLFPFQHPISHFNIPLIPILTFHFNIP